MTCRSLYIWAGLWWVQFCYFDLCPLLSDGNVSQKDALTNTYKSCYTTSPFFPFGAAACQSFLGPSKEGPATPKVWPTPAQLSPGVRAASFSQQSRNNKMWWTQSLSRTEKMYHIITHEKIWEKERCICFESGLTLSTRLHLKTKVNVFYFGRNSVVSVGRG